MRTARALRGIMRAGREKVLLAWIALVLTVLYLTVLAPAPSSCFLQARKAQPVLPRVSIVAKRSSPLLRVAEVASQVQHVGSGESDDGGFFSSAFKDALNSALQRNK
jgi:hypothetical protein